MKEGDHSMKLSIIDQAPISSNQSAKDALNNSLRLAQAAEKLGYVRYWIAEHHDLPGLACSAPEIMIPYICANTSQIRVGSGAVLLPFYRPYKVAETYNMLATLFPNRIDIGIGRAPGGSAEATNALHERYLEQVWKMPEHIKELLQFISQSFPADHEYSKISASPLPEIPPKLWLLGTSSKSAKLAAENGIPYAYGYFMSENDGKEIIQAYLDSYYHEHLTEQPQVIITVSAVCAETTQKAEDIALSSLIWSIQRAKGEDNEGVPSIEEAKKYQLTNEEEGQLEKLKRKMIIGDPSVVIPELTRIQQIYKANEIMINTITHYPEDRIISYSLIAENSN